MLRGRLKGYVSDTKGKIVTIRVDEDLHKVARVRIAELDTSFQQVVGDLLRQWAMGRGISGENAAVRESQHGTLSKSDAALVAQFLDFWHNPHDSMDTKLRNLLAEVFEVREKHSKDRRKSTA